MSITDAQVVPSRGLIVNQLPPIEFLQECFDYFPETGKVLWKKRPLSHFVDDVAMRKWNTRNAGRECRRPQPRGHMSVALKFNGIQISYQLHRIVWAICRKEFPEGYVIDHINRCPSDNRLENLRCVPQQVNTWNSATKKRTQNLGLPRGVYPNGKKFQAKIRHNYQEICLGTFLTPEEAHAAFVAKAIELRGESTLTD